MIYNLLAKNNKEFLICDDLISLQLILIEVQHSLDNIIIHSNLWIVLSADRRLKFKLEKKFYEIER